MIDSEIPATMTSTDPDRSPSVWVVIPAYNEQPRIESCLKELLRNNRSSVVVVDDGSSDATAKVARQFPVWVLRHCVNCGQGAAIKTGIDFALQRGADIIVTFDADGQHDASELKSLIEPVARGDFDVALGTRFQGNAIGIPMTRRLLLRCAVMFTRLVSGLNLTDAHNGLRAFSRNAAQTIRIKQPRMAHASEILDQIGRHNLRYCEVPVTIRYTDETLAKGQSSLDAAQIGSDMLIGRFLS